jgi:hypothetical protein
VPSDFALTDQIIASILNCESINYRVIPSANEEANEMDENDSQSEKHDEPRISIS